MPLKSTVDSAGGIYKRYARLLEKLGIVTFGDFLYHIPFRYNDYSIISKTGEVQPGEVVTLRGRVTDINNQYTRKRFTIQKIKMDDGSGIIEAVWFNQPYITKNLSVDEHISLSGKVNVTNSKLIMQNPDFEVGEKDFLHTGRLVPVYNETRGVSSKWIRRQIFKILSENKSEIEDFLPKAVLSQEKFQDLYGAFYAVHFPNSIEEVERGKRRLSFDELFLTQAASLIRKAEWKKNLKGIPFQSFREKIEDFIKNLPFELTEAQKKAVSEVLLDLTSDQPMNRLLEGDVGSGKTVVAAIASYLTSLNGLQTVIMAPTEILANQHYKTISDLFTPFKLKVGIATSAKKEKTDAFDVLIGTHAVIGKNIKIDNLGLVVIDEQQRFGVEQRSILRKKGTNPHVLTMTATPIPRTIALTLYGDLSLSVLGEMPKGRKIIKTWLVPTVKREDAYVWIKKQIKERESQVFIVCPFIEESETLGSVKAATKEFESLRNSIFKEYRLELMHGKIKAKDKEKILAEFKDHKFDILVATPVVEVGIDIPGADIILIEASERFGLSQLHQLRGRVGRGEEQAYCLLFTESSNPLTIQRLKSMEKTNIGSELAEMDLRLRGPGEMYGTQQHGRKYLKIANFSDFDLIKKTRNEAEKYTDKLDSYPLLKKKIEEINIAEVSPD